MQQEVTCKVNKISKEHGVIFYSHELRCKPAATAAFSGHATTATLPSSVAKTGTSVSFSFLFDGTLAQTGSKSGTVCLPPRDIFILQIRIVFTQDLICILSRLAVIKTGEQPCITIPCIDFGSICPRGFVLFGAKYVGSASPVQHLQVDRCWVFGFRDSSNAVSILDS